MKEEARRLDVIRISGDAAERRRDLVVKERSVTIFLNDVELVTLLCSPRDLEYLAVGFLFGEGFINSEKDIKRIYAGRKEGAVWVETHGGKRPKENILTKRLVTTGCGKGLSFAGTVKGMKGRKTAADFRMPASLVPMLMRKFQGKSEVFRKTGGVHSAGLANRGRIVCFSEDIGRHNAIDKVFGECLLKGMKTDRLVLVTSGRVSSDIIVKAGRSRTPIIVSKSAPTDMAVTLARDLGIALVGFARGSRMNVYSHEWRIVAKPQRK